VGNVNATAVLCRPPMPRIAYLGFIFSSKQINVPPIAHTWLGPETLVSCSIQNISLLWFLIGIVKHNLTYFSTITTGNRTHVSRVAPRDGAIQVSLRYRLYSEPATLTQDQRKFWRKITLRQNSSTLMG